MISIEGNKQLAQAYAPGQVCQCSGPVVNSGGLPIDCPKCGKVLPPTQTEGKFDAYWKEHNKLEKEYKGKVRELKKSILKWEEDKDGGREATEESWKRLLQKVISLGKQYKGRLKSLARQHGKDSPGGFDWLAGDLPEYVQDQIGEALELDEYILPSFLSVGGRIGYHLGMLLAPFVIDTTEKLRKEFQLWSKSQGEQATWDIEGYLNNIQAEAEGRLAGFAKLKKHAPITRELLDDWNEFLEVVRDNYEAARAEAKKANVRVPWEKFKKWMRYLRVVDRRLKKLPVAESRVVLHSVGAEMKLQEMLVEASGKEFQQKKAALLRALENENERIWSAISRRHGASRRRYGVTPKEKEKWNEANRKYRKLCRRYQERYISLAKEHGRVPGYLDDSGSFRGHVKDLVNKAKAAHKKTKNESLELSEAIDVVERGGSPELVGRQLVEVDLYEGYPKGLPKEKRQAYVKERDKVKYYFKREIEKTEAKYKKKIADNKDWSSREADKYDYAPGSDGYKSIMQDSKEFVQYQQEHMEYDVKKLRKQRNQELKRVKRKYVGNTNESLDLTEDREEKMRKLTQWLYNQSGDEFERFMTSSIRPEIKRLKDRKDKNMEKNEKERKDGLKLAKEADKESRKFLRDEVEAMYKDMKQAYASQYADGIVKVLKRKKKEWERKKTKNESLELDEAII